MRVGAEAIRAPGCTAGREVKTEIPLITPPHRVAGADPI